MTSLACLDGRVSASFWEIAAAVSSEVLRISRGGVSEMAEGAIVVVLCCVVLCCVVLVVRKTTRMKEKNVGFERSIGKGSMSQSI